MFGKKKPAAGRELSQKDIIANQIERLGLGQSLSYKLSENCGGGLAVIELNPRYPEKRQRKYILSTDKIVDGEPTGKKYLLFGHDNPKVLAGWVVDRQGEAF